MSSVASPTTEFNTRDYMTTLREVVRGGSDAGLVVVRLTRLARGYEVEAVDRVNGRVTLRGDRADLLLQLAADHVTTTLHS